MLVYGLRTAHQLRDAILKWIDKPIIRSMSKSSNAEIQNAKYFDFNKFLKKI